METGLLGNGVQKMCLGINYLYLLLTAFHEVVYSRKVRGVGSSAPGYPSCVRQVWTKRREAGQVPAPRFLQTSS